MSLQIDRSIKKALKLRARSQLKHAFQILEEVCEIEPNNKRAQNYLAKIKAEYFKQTLGLNPPLEIQEKLKLLFDKKEWNYLISAGEPVEKYFPKSVPILNMLGVAYREIGDMVKANDCHHRALKADPQHSATYINLTNSYIAQGKFSEALAMLNSHLKHAKLNKTQTTTASNLYNNLGRCLYYLGRHQQAQKAYEMALQYNKSNDEASFNLGAINLFHRQFKLGWELREFRRSRLDFLAASQGINKPQWFGNKDEVVFCWAEEGLGDEVMAASCLDELSCRMERLIVSADRRLLPIFKRSFTNIQFICRDDNYHSLAFDSQIPSMTALGMLRPSVGSFKVAARGYLTPNETLVNQLRGKIKDIAGDSPIIGISWKTAAAVTGKKRSIDLRTFLRGIPENFTVVSLQYGDCRAEIELAEMGSQRKIYTVDYIDNKNDIDSLGALISACDRVVTVDNSTVHLAGAFGVKCYLLLPKAADFRWSDSDESSYWYESVKILRQQTDDAWSHCLTKLAQKLR